MGHDESDSSGCIVCCDVVGYYIVENFNREILTIFMGQNKAAKILVDCGMEFTILENY